MKQQYNKAVTHEEIVRRLAEKGISLSDMAVSNYRRGRSGSRFAADIDATEVEALADQIKKIKRAHAKLSRAING